MKRIYSVLWFAIIMLLSLACKKENESSSAPGLKKGLLAFFPLNDSFEDSTGNIENIAHSGSITGIKDRKGNSNAAFNFGGGHFSFDCDAWSADPMSMSLWVKLKDNNGDNYFVQASSAAFGVYQSVNQIGFVISTPSTNSAMSPISSEWTHMVGTYDGKDIKTYINGQLVQTTNNPGMPNKSSKVVIGGIGDPKWMGALDELRFYNRVLSDEEILLLAKL